MLTPSQQARVAAALDRAWANADQAAKLASGDGVLGTLWSGVRGLWSRAIGAGSSYDALYTDADSTRRLAEDLTAKAEGWQTSGWPVEDVEVADFERAAGATSNEAAIATANQLDPRTAAGEVLGPIVRPSLWPSWLWAVLAVVGLVVVVLLLSIAGVRGRR